MVIVKNEVVYLVEWVYYYLYFGILVIEVYYNGCNDNIFEVVEVLSNEFVIFINVDVIFENFRVKL